MPLAAISLLACLLTGCGAILYSSQQELKIQPSGAKLEVYSWDGKLVEAAKNESDSTLTVHRPIEPSYLIRLSKEGYCPRYWITISEASGPLVYFDLFISFLSLPIGPLIFSASYAVTKNAGAFTQTEFILNSRETEQCGP